MPKVLNQDELDALLNMVQSSGSKPAGAATGGHSGVAALLRTAYNVVPAESLRRVDFKRPERLSAEQASSLEMVHETFARNAASSLSGYLRTVIDIRLISVEQFTYSEFTMSVPSPTHFNSLSCKPLQGNMVLEMNPSIIFPFIDRLLGGRTQSADLIERPFTHIERALIDTIQSRLLEQLQTSWSPITPVEFCIVESETNPLLLQIVAPNEPVILLTFELLMGESSGLVNLCIPFKVIEPVIDEFTQADWFSPEPQDASIEERCNVLSNLEKIRLDVRVDLGDVRLRLEDILGLRVGDIIELDRGVDSDLALRIGDELAFVGRPARFRGKNAVTLGGPVDPRRAIL